MRPPASPPPLPPPHSPPPWSPLLARPRSRSPRFRAPRAAPAARPPAPRPAPPPAPPAPAPAAPLAGAPASDPVPIPGPPFVDAVRWVLEQLYVRLCPAKVCQVPQLLERNKRREVALLRAALDKYVLSLWPVCSGSRLEACAGA
ncbi:unnamed protein product [Effrenium voratum]|nr:unnamed protein product [Effrenium voratum]